MIATYVSIDFNYYGRLQRYMIITEKELTRTEKGLIYAKAYELADIIAMGTFGFAIGDKIYDDDDELEAFVSMHSMPATNQEIESFTLQQFLDWDWR